MKMNIIDLLFILCSTWFTVSSFAQYQQLTKPPTLQCINKVMTMTSHNHTEVLTDSAFNTYPCRQM